MKKLTILTVLLSFSLLSWNNPPSMSKKLKKIMGNNWAFIPTGNVKIGDAIQSIDEYYILKTETSNLDYLTFLKTLKQTKSPLYATALPDTSVWSNKMNKNESYVTQYFRYPGFRLYPVVGVSHANAQLYCKWMEETINAQLEGNEKIVVRLPTEMEWTRAARGDYQSALYPWEGFELKSKKGKNLANYKKDNQRDSDGIMITAEIYSYPANQFGIYQMSGNLAEMLDIPKKVKGGSWNMPAKSLKIDESEMVDYPANNVGFRPVLTVVAK